TVDMTTGTLTKFTGVGLGDVNGLAVDPATGTACTTTEIDFSVEFYNLATQTGFAQPLPGATNQFFSGADVEFDPVNHLFLVAQPNSSTASSGSSIHVYDVSGNLVESINGFAQWCEIRTTVFGWTRTRFPLHIRSAKELTINETPIITVVGKAFWK